MKNTFFLCYDDENQLRLLILLLHKVKKMMTKKEEYEDDFPFYPTALFSVKKLILLLQEEKLYSYIVIKR